MASNREKIARLVIIEGKDNRDKGKIIALKKTYVIIGRGQADIVLNDLQVSRAHVALEWNEKQGELTFTDLGSTNGTLVNGELRKSGVLKDRDRLKVGHTVFDCQLENESQTEIGTSAHLKSESHLSKSQSASLAGPSRLGSAPQIADAFNASVGVQEPQVSSSQKSLPEIEKVRIDYRAQLLQKVPRSARLGVLSSIVIAGLILLFSGNPNRTISNKNLETYVSEVSKLIESGELEKAKTMSLEAVKAYPTHSVPLVLLGNVYFEQRKIDLSIDAYRRSLILKPIQLITHTRLIRLYLIIKKPEEAKNLLADFLPLLQSGTSNPKLYVQTGELFLDYPELEPNKDQTLKFARDLQTKFAPNDPMGYKIESNLIYLNDKSPEGIKKAEEILKKGLALSPKDEWIFDRLFYLKIASNNFVEATSRLDEWIKSVPKSTKPLLLYSYLKFNENKFLEAIPFLQKILNILSKDPYQPHYSEALNLMGNISMQQNQLAEAENFLRQSCQYGYKPSCSHPLITGNAPEKISKSNNSPNQNREPVSAPPREMLEPKTQP